MAIEEDDRRTPGRLIQTRRCAIQLEENGGGYTKKAENGEERFVAYFAPTGGNKAESNHVRLTAAPSSKLVYSLALAHPRAV